jgi:hypothetical protein
VRLVEGERRDLDLRSKLGTSTELRSSREDPSRLPAYVTLGLGAASLGVGAAGAVLRLDDADALGPAALAAALSNLQRNAIVPANCLAFW